MAMYPTANSVSQQSSQGLVVKGQQPTKADAVELTCAICHKDLRYFEKDEIRFDCGTIMQPQTCSIVRLDCGHHLHARCAGEYTAANCPSCAVKISSFELEAHTRWVYYHGWGVLDRTEVPDFEMIDDTDCPICSEPLFEPLNEEVHPDYRLVRTTKYARFVCGHSIHENCAAISRKTRGPACPKCNTEILSEAEEEELLRQENEKAEECLRLYDEKTEAQLKKERRYKCNLCTKEYTCMGWLIKHYIKVHSGYTSQCVDCSEKFMDYCGLDDVWNSKLLDHQPKCQEYRKNKTAVYDKNERYIVVDHTYSVVSSDDFSELRDYTRPLYLWNVQFKKDPRISVLDWRGIDYKVRLKCA